MKKFLLLIGVMVGLMSFTGQNEADAIVNAFRVADATQVGQYFDDLLDVKFPNKDEVKNMGRNQATISLKAFFADNGIKGFEKTSEREVGATMYITGKLNDGAKGHNITILLRAKDGKRQIISLRIS